LARSFPILNEILRCHLNQRDFYRYEFLENRHEDTSWKRLISSDLQLDLKNAIAIIMYCDLWTRYTLHHRGVSRLLTGGW